MSTAIIDPDEVRLFANNLIEGANYLHERQGAFESSFIDLNEVWRDKKYEDFRQVFNETMNRMDKFLQYAEAYSQYLRRKADLADDYLRGGY